MLGEPFVERKTTKQPGFTVGVLMNSKKKETADVGIEIEVEGKNLLYNHMAELPALKYWIYVEDHSLRGAESGEYVLTKPIKFKEVKPAIEGLYKAFKANKTKFDDSNRTSVHVHLNCQNFYLNRLTSFMALWFTVEEILTQWCGEHRVGNLFCLRSRDATAIISHLRKFIKSDCKYDLNDNLHYAGLNAHALRKYGSIEIRTMRGVSDPKIIIDWVEILQRLYEYSAEFTDPRDVCSMFSGYGPLQMFNNILGGKVATVRSGITWTDQDIRDAMYRGIRFAQDLCYCRDWSLYNPQELKEDPFKRPANKVAKSLLQKAEQFSSVEVFTEWNEFMNNAVYTPSTIQWSN